MVDCPIDQERNSGTGRAGMKFDAGRVVTLAKSFEQTRAAGSSLSTRAGELFESLMRDQGIATVHSEPSPRKRSIGAPLLSALILTSLVLTWRVFFPGSMIVICAYVIYYFVVNLFIKLPAEGPSLIAGAVEQSRATRVVILTTLTTPMRRSTVRFRRFVMIPSLSFGFLTLIPVVASTLQQSRFVAGLFAVVHLLFIVILGWIGAPFRTPSAFNGDNRTGIAMLVELARSWPSSMSSRMDALFILSPAGSSIPNRSDGKPTLLITLDAPGVGASNTIVGGEFAEKTVRDLWLPDRYWFGVSGKGVEEVMIQGAHDDSPIDPPALERASQLITELSLRWARQNS